MATIKTIHIALLEPNIICRLGLEQILKKLPHYRVQIEHIREQRDDDYSHMLSSCTADIVIANPIYLGATPRKHIAALSLPTKLIALSYGTLSRDFGEYDEVIDISATQSQILEVIDRLCQRETPVVEENGKLTNREKEIVVCVAKGMTNKEIAETLFLSTYTVITHRRNISKKLQINSPAGLTIYAIMNKLVDLEEIEKSKKHR